MPDANLPKDPSVGSIDYDTLVDNAVEACTNLDQISQGDQQLVNLAQNLARDLYTIRLAILYTNLSEKVNITSLRFNLSYLKQSRLANEDYPFVIGVKKYTIKQLLNDLLRLTENN